MKIKMSTAELQRAIRNIKSCSARGANGVQQLEFYVNNSQATITASNGVAMAQARIDCAGGDCRFSLDGKNFIAYCEKFDGEETVLSVADQMVTAKCGGITARIAKVSDEATDPLESQAESVEMESEQFKHLMTIALSCAGVNDLRPVLNGVYLVADNGKITAVGCDSFKLAVYKSEIPKSNAAIKAIIPASAIASVTKSPIIGGGNCTVKISPFRGTKIRISCDDKTSSAVFVCNLIQGDYVDYDRLLPKSADVEYEIDACSIADAVSTAQIAESKTYLKFTFQGDTVTVSSVSSTTQVDIQKDCKSTGRDTSNDPFVIGFNGTYFSKVVGVIGDSFKMSMSNPVRPAVLYNEMQYNSETAESVTLMLLPVRMRE